MADDLFKTTWLRAGYDGIGPLYFLELSHSGEIQEASRYRYPRRDGQDGEDLGSTPIVVTGRMIFSTEIDPELYPKRFVEMTKRKAEPGAKVFVHPDRGSILGRFTQWDVSYSPMKVNTALVQFAFESFNEDQIANDPDAQNKLDKALAAAGEVDAGTELILDRSKRPSPPLTTDLESFSALLSTPSATVQGIESFANSYRAKVDLLLAQTEMIDPRNYQLYKSAVATAALVQDLAAQAKTNAPQDVPYTLTTDTWPLVLAQEVYNDRSRAKDIVDRNPSPTPWYRKGRTLRLPDR